MVLTTRNGSPRVLRNAGAEERAWTRVALRDAGGSWGGYGARVEVVTGDNRQVGHVTGGGSFLSQSDTALYFGLGAATQIDSLVVRWQNGEAETFRDLPVRVSPVVEQGAGVSFDVAR